MDAKTRAAIEALALLASSFVVLVTAGAWLSARGPLGVTAAELGCVLAPTLLYARARRLSAASLGLGRPPLVATALAFVAGAAACWLMARGLEPWLERWWPMPPSLRRALEQMAGGQPIAVELVTMALLPAFAEELLFRGVVWEAWRPLLGTGGTIFATAIAFALFHGSPHRFPLVAFAGLLLGAARASSPSLWPAIAFHVANNTGALIALRLGP